MSLLVYFGLFLLLVVTEPSRQLNEKEINFAVLAPNSINLKQDYFIIISVAASESCSFSKSKNQTIKQVIYNTKSHSAPK